MHHNPTPDVASRYGAPMGRRSAPACDLDISRRISLRRVRLNTGGYDAGGAYWGLGMPLWCAMDHTGEAVFFRARDRYSAKIHIQQSHVHGAVLRFYR